MISIEISQYPRSSCQPGILNRHIRFHFMWKWDRFYVINVSISIAWLNICQPLVMWYLSSGVLCSHRMIRNALVHICNTLNDTCCIQFRIYSRFHQVYRQLGAGGRLIAITIILPFYPRPVMAFGYCRCLRVCVCVCPSITSLSAR